MPQGWHLNLRQSIVEIDRRVRSPLLIITKWNSTIGRFMQEAICAPCREVLSRSRQPFE